jgi:hypothetical protein
VYGFETNTRIMIRMKRSRGYLGLMVVMYCLSGGASMTTSSWARDPGAVPQGASAQAASLADSGSRWPNLPDGQPNSCEQAGIAAEQASGLPTGLLLAIGRVESGRWDPMRGRTTSWPWTINAAGKGLWFDTKEAAAQTTRALLDGGTRSIDVGCFQINLQYHPLAFENLEQGFDPVANARYAARFLLSLFSRTGSWEAAVEAYHSADPVLGFAYRQQVFSVWGPATAAADVPVRTATSVMLASHRTPMAMPVVIAGVQIWTPMPFGTAASVVAMPGSSAQAAPGASVVATMPPLPVVTYRVMPRR